MVFSYQRTIRFQDTDAAGVVYFAQGLAICHEAYEQSLAAAGINPRSFFRLGEYIFPIIHAEIDFFQPMHCGDQIQVRLTAQLISASSFQVQYQIANPSPTATAAQTQEQMSNGDAQTMVLEDRSESHQQRCIAQALTRHVCLQTQPRQKAALPPNLLSWLTQMG